MRVYQKLEKHYRDMQDMEFTVQKGKLWMLQTRNGKRTAKGRFKIAVDMATAKVSSREDEAVPVSIPAA
jgi:pyruvate,orthophosphate dikinase